MQLHFLGTSGYHPTSRRHTACFMVPEQGVILDAGTGLFRIRELVRTARLDIFLSHAHIDHCVGLTFLLDSLPAGFSGPVRVHLDPAKHAAIEEKLFAKDLFPVRPAFELLPLGRDPVPLPGGGILRTFPLVHPGGCLGMRLDWPGHSMAYITDTMATDDAPYLEHVRNVDLLVHECYFPDGWEERAALTGHSCLSPVARLARAAAARQTCLVHLNPLDGDASSLDLQSVAGICPGLRLAEDGMVLDF